VSVPATYTADWSLAGRLGDVLAFAVVSGRVTADEVEFLEWALDLADALCAGDLVVRRPDEIRARDDALVEAEAEARWAAGLVTVPARFIEEVAV
jgi:hypothetical protein